MLESLPAKTWSYTIPGIELKPSKEMACKEENFWDVSLMAM